MLLAKLFMAIPMTIILMALVPVEKALVFLPFAAYLLADKLTDWANRCDDRIRKNRESKTKLALIKRVGQ